MKVEEYRYTTLWAIFDGKIDKKAILKRPTDAVRIAIGSENGGAFGPDISDDDVTALANAANKFKRTRLAFDATCKVMWRGLSKFHNLHGIQVSSISKQTIPLLNEIPETIKELGYLVDKDAEAAAKTISKFRLLESISFYGQLKGLESLLDFPRLNSLNVQYVANIDLQSLEATKKLRSFSMAHGSIANYPSKKGLAAIEELGIWKTRNVDSLAWLAEMKKLRSLSVGAQRQVTSLPDFSRHAALHKVHLTQMKGLLQLRPLAKAPRLRTLHVEDMNQIPLEEYAAFAGHPTLTAISSGYSSCKKDEQVQELVGLPRIDYELAANLEEF
jgi:hypothetical protein